MMEKNEYVELYLSSESKFDEAKLCYGKLYTDVTGTNEVESFVSGTRYYYAKITDNLDDRSGCGLTYSEYNNAKSKMLQSIKANGGFWISRYEAGIEGSVQTPALARTEKGEITASSPKAVSKPDHIPYNWITCSQAQNLANQMSPNTTKNSSLLFGIQWDLVCKYLDGKDGLTTADINDDSASWGNFYDSTLNITSTKAMGAEFNRAEWTLGEYQNITEKTAEKEFLLTTGASIKTKKMNIYDFAGNELEWTLEFGGKTAAESMLRSGEFNEYGDVPACCRWHETTETAEFEYGFRVSLY